MAVNKKKPGDKKKPDKTNERSRAPRRIYLTVQTEEASLRLAVNSETGKVESLEANAAEGNEPFVVATEAGSFIGLPAGVNRTFTINLANAPSSEDGSV